MKQSSRTCVIISAFLLLLLLCGQATLTKATSTWNIQTVDSTGTVEASTSLALDSGGNPHISYQDATRKDLKYATWTGSAWRIQTVDSNGAGYFTSLALDSAGNPHISYEANGDLKYAALVSPQTSTPTSTPTPTPLGDFWITVSAGPGGTIDGPSGFTSPGTSPYTYTITPAFGYEIVDVTVDGVSQGKISTYTLTEEGNHEISATFAPTQTLTIIAVGIVVAVVVLVAVLFAVFRARKRTKLSVAKDSASLSPPKSPPA